MILTKSFNDLLTNKINLNQTRIDKIISAHKNVRSYLENNEKIKPYFKDTYLQGSYAQKTAIKPTNENDYDVDIVLTMNWKNKDGDFKGTTEIKQLIYSALEDSPIYKYKLMPHHSQRCISLQYDEFHLDILPAHSDDDGTNVIWIIDTQNEWKKSNPKDFSQWCADINSKTDFIFKRVIKIMKYWRNLQFGEHHTPKSIVLTTIIGNNISYSNISNDRTLVEVLENIAKNYDISEDKVPEILNPSLLEENLSRKWKLQDYNKFVKKIKKAAETARKALDEKKDIQIAIDLWNSTDIFDGQLPSTSLEDQEEVEEALRYNKLQQEEKLFIGQSGTLSETKSGNLSNVPKARSWSY